MTQCCSALDDSTAEYFGATRAARDLAAYRASGPGRTTRGLLAGLTATGVRPATLLDIGSGIGTLSFEVLEAGAVRATCVDMSPAFAECGRTEAVRRGVADRISWRTADFVTVASELPAADLVTLDRVVCCYPAFDVLLRHAADHADILLAISYPQDRWYVRLAFAAENLGRKLRGRAFRSYVHPPVQMDALLVRAGFRRMVSDSTMMWQMAIYCRAANCALDIKSASEDHLPADRLR
jgi:magnesium-protoporphyrin O-methyltransferase